MATARSAKRSTRANKDADKDNDRKKVDSKGDDNKVAPSKRHTLAATIRKKVTKKEDDPPASQKRTTTKTPRKRSTTAKSATKAAGASTKTKTNETKRTKTIRSGRLEADLKKYSGEEFTQADLLAGVQLAVQVAGLEALAPTLLALLTEWIPGLDERIEKEAIQSLKAAVKKKYASCTVDQRKTLRAVIHWVGNDFKLHTTPETAAFTTGFSGIPVVESQTEPLKLRPFIEQ